MARTEADRIHFIRAAKQAHESFWDKLRPEMRRYRQAYLTKFYEDDLLRPAEGQIRVETADAYAAIESIMGSLFAKYPAVTVGLDIQGDGDQMVVTELSNNFLKDTRQQIENAARQALLYGSSYFKLAPRESNNLLGKVALRAVPPWQVIVDRDAAAWEDSRFIGHIYYIPVDEANAKWGNKKWTGIQQVDYFTDSSRTNDKVVSAKLGDRMELPNEYLYIQIVEMYDFLNDELLFWSPQWKSGEELLSKDAIPVRTYDGRPLASVVPLFFSRKPDRPMEGYSALSRIYDQIFEKNILRTFWANAVRRDSRQYIYKEGAIDEEALSKITSGVDGLMIPVDNDTLAGVIDVVPVNPMSSNHGVYLNYIESDLNKGSLTAAFTRGEASKATATEIGALMQYTASELGKMARDRDSSIESAAQLYVRMLIPLVDEGDGAVVVTPDGGKAVTVARIDADWRFYSTDGGSTPQSDLLKKQQLIQLTPTLMQLGVSPDKIREEIVRLFGLPDIFNEVAPPASGGDQLPPEIAALGGAGGAPPVGAIGEI
jgi:hypothetical protein